MKPQFSGILGANMFAADQLAKKASMDKKVKHERLMLIGLGIGLLWLLKSVFK